MDPVPAAVGSAIHDALMNFERQMEAAYSSGQLPDENTAMDILVKLIDRALVRAQLDKSEPAVRARLKSAEAGLNVATREILTDMPRWAVTPGGVIAVWSEAWLDHGPGVPAVRLAPGFIVPTRADVIGIRAEDGGLRPVVKDYKSRRDPVHPAFDDGIIIRAIWVMDELASPSCEWFAEAAIMTGKVGLIDVEVVNILKGGTNDSVIRHTLSAASLEEHRRRLIAVLEEMDAVACISDSSLVIATPGALCKEWCPFLHRCGPGQAHVRKYYGEGPLDERLAELN